MRSMDVSRSPDPLVAYSRIPYHVPPARVLVRSRSHLTCFPLLYRYGLSTRPRILVCTPYLLSSLRLVFMLTITAYAFPFQSVDSSAASLFLDSDSLLSHFPFLYLCTCISQTTIYTGWRWGSFPIFNLLCNHPKGVTCEIPRTLLVLSSSLAKATALRS